MGLQYKKRRMPSLNHAPGLGVWLSVAEQARFRSALSDSPDLPDAILRLIKSTKPVDHLTFVPALVNLLADRGLTTTDEYEKEFTHMFLNDFLLFPQKYSISETGPLSQDEEATLVQGLVRQIAVSENAAAKAEFLAPYLGRMRVFPRMIDTLRSVHSPLVNLIGLINSVTVNGDAKKNAPFIATLTAGDWQSMRQLALPHLEEFLSAVEQWVASRDNPEQGQGAKERVYRALIVLIFSMGKQYPRLYLILRDFLHSINDELLAGEGIPRVISLILLRREFSAPPW